MMIDTEYNPGNWISIKVAASLLGWDVRTLRRRQAAKRMPPRRRFSRQLRYNRADILKLRDSIGPQAKQP